MSEDRPDADGGSPTLAARVPDARPLLSVVVPFYNVQAYLEECLQSLQEQTLTDFEVIMIDDGSPDDSVTIARRFAEQDRRFVLVRQQNQGLGPARNTGVAHARGQYLAFVDSDDVVAPRAYALMVGSLERTGSAFVAADVYRFGVGYGFRQSWTHRTVCRQARAGTTIGRHPELMGDRMVWNKVYRRSFWDAHQFEFPAIKYEDYPVTLRAYLEAPAIDILTNHVYFWRERESGDSITQQSANLDNVRDRFLSAIAVLDVLDRHYPTPTQVRERVHGYFIHIDLVSMAESMLRCAPDDRSEIEQMLLVLAQRLDPAAGFRATRFARLVHRALLDGDLAGARDLATWRMSGDYKTLLRRVARSGRPWRLPAVIKATGLLRRRQLPWRQRRLKSSLVSAAWDGDVLRLTVHSRLRGRLARLVRGGAELIGASAATRLPSSVRAAEGGVEIATEIDPSDLDAMTGGATAQLVIGLRLGPLRWRGAVSFDAEQLPGARRRLDGRWVQPRAISAGFGLARLTDPFVVEGAEAVDGHLRVVGGLPGQTLTVQRPDPSEDLEFTFDRAGVLSMVAADLVRDDPPDNMVNRVAERTMSWLRQRDPLELHRLQADAMMSAAQTYRAAVERAEESGRDPDDVDAPELTVIDPVAAEPVLMMHQTATIRWGDTVVGVVRNRAGQLCIRQQPIDTVGTAATAEPTELPELPEASESDPESQPAATALTAE